MNYDDYMDTWDICKELGIETQEDLALFKEREVEQGESLLGALIRYEQEYLSI